VVDRTWIWEDGRLASGGLWAGDTSSQGAPALRTFPQSAVAATAQPAIPLGLGVGPVFGEFAEWFCEWVDSYRAEKGWRAQRAVLILERAPAEGECRCFACLCIPQCDSRAVPATFGTCNAASRSVMRSFKRLRLTNFDRMSGDPRHLTNAFVEPRENLATLQKDTDASGDCGLHSRSESGRHDWLSRGIGLPVLRPAPLGRERASQVASLRKPPRAGATLGRRAVPSDA
jgi:hypothetical protein